MTMLFSVTASAAVMILCGLLLRALLRHRLPAGFFRALWILTALRCLIFAEIPSPVSILALVQSGVHAVPGTFTGAWQAVIPFSGESVPAPSPQTADQLP
jgi:beta-lactamase regulating signal transducer with metallopeptidase domain